MFEINTMIKEHGSLIKYDILPANKIVSILIIKDNETFNQILQKYKGVLQERNDQHLYSDTNFQLMYPRFDFSGKARIYKLANGLCCIDQSRSIKGNPYYICESYEDYILITKYLLIYTLEELKTPVVECHLSNPKLISDFLSAKELTEIDNLKLPENSKLYKANNGYYVLVEFVPKDGFGELFNLAYQITDKSESDIVYHSLVIYETLETMKLSGAIEIE